MAKTPAGGARPPRADARRNQERILAAAREAFTRHGVDASLNDIARRAGVGPGTLYRHFPTREALLEAMLADRYHALAGHARDLAGTAPPAEAVPRWLSAFVRDLRAFRGLATSMKNALYDEGSVLFVSCKEMQVAWDVLVVHAQVAGVVRQDASPADLLRLAAALAWATEDLPEDTTEADRLLDLMLTGVMRG
ncbi:TetR/AcrR family transcriptional regulator [Sinosporangium siamense]|uniref:TetR family transcriptional regulator n=1 Tax=Sinosporangium siamense TaxID=1367973 RepID=A0A919RE67_9ACTN|nr:TetR/AcrR family transcriptional regulator [Sinosporangium siamense]GII92245.1 TetR family transcriptional regulator [Sinosporangium siamense]